MTGHKFRRPDKDRHTFAQLSKRIRYNHVTGVLERIGSGKSTVGNIKSTGYMRIKIDRVDYLYHHVVWFLCKQSWPVEIDHIDRNKQNNKITNLRECSRIENQAGIKKPIIRSDGVRYDGIVDAAKAMSWVGKSFMARQVNINKSLRRGGTAYGFRWSYAT